MSTKTYSTLSESEIEIPEEYLSVEGDIVSEDFGKELRDLILEDVDFEVGLLRVATIVGSANLDDKNQFKSYEGGVKSMFTGFSVCASNPETAEENFERVCEVFNDKSNLGYLKTGEIEQTNGKYEVEFSTDITPPKIDVGYGESGEYGISSDMTESFSEALEDSKDELEFKLYDSNFLKMKFNNFMADSRMDERNVQKITRTNVIVEADNHDEALENSKEAFNVILENMFKREVIRNNFTYETDDVKREVENVEKLQ